MHFYRIVSVSRSSSGRLVDSNGVRIYDQRKRNAAAAAVWSVVGCLVYTYVQKENVKKVQETQTEKETERKKRRKGKNADTDGNEIKNEECKAEKNITIRLQMALVVFLLRNMCAKQLAYSNRVSVSDVPFNDDVCSRVNNMLEHDVSFIDFSLSIDSLVQTESNFVYCARKT